MSHSAETAEALLKAMANRNRLMILCQLIAGERSVGDLAESLGVRASTMSQHLALLRKDGLVATRRDGQTVWYTVASDPARQIVETLYQIYCMPSAICPVPENHASVKGKRK